MVAEIHKKSKAPIIQKVETCLFHSFCVCVRFLGHYSPYSISILFHCV